jgi:DNA-binding SARP family transcriptional activator/tetratricopeptide (TPR) repeat protein
MEFRLLGPVEIRVGGQILDAGHVRQRAVLAVLLLELGQVVSAESLIDRVWGHDPPVSARNVLSGHVARLKAVLAGDAGVSLSRRAGGYLLSANPERVDIWRFRALVTRAAGASDEQSVTLLRGALGLWHGPALAGLRGRWLDGMRHALERERAGALLELTDVRLRLGEHHALVAELAGQADAAPADERLVGQLMLALYRCGQQAEALRWFERTRLNLADELGADPGPQLRVLHQQILRADPALALPANGSGAKSSSSVAGPVPRQLPADVAAFTGRANELAALDLLLLHAAPDGPAPSQVTAAVISAVSGTAGVGKTALAVHWAHGAAGQFPGGQLYVNLRGYDPDQPVTAADALAGFLRSLGVPGADIPAEETERAARYRSLLAGKRTLVVLDNASSTAQVRPLLPGHHECAVVVTSRDPLAGLVARNGAVRLDLDLLPAGDAVTLLRQLIGGRVDTEPAAALTLAEQCARLPLALRVAAELAAARPRARLADLVTELGGQQDRLNLLQAGGDPATSVRAVFSWSYEQLSDEAARMFRLLGLHPGPDISVPAAASLAAVAETEAGRLLGELACAHLIAEPVPGRYAFHDLLRAYAASQARAQDDEGDREAAITRVLGHYLHTATRAALLVNPAKEPVDLVPPGPGVKPENPGDYSQSVAWFEAEHQVLLAMASLADSCRFGCHSWQLPWAMVDFLHLRGRYQEAAATQRTALAAAVRLGDTAAQALTGRLLASSYVNLGDHDQARHYYTSSGALYQQLGNRLGEAKIQHSLGWLAERQGRYADALGHCDQALRLFQAIGDQKSEANVLNAVGWCYCLLGDYQQARAFCRRSLTLCAETGQRRLEGAAWDSLGYIEHQLGNLAEAAACYERALSLKREAGEVLTEAVILTHLGDAHHAAGDLDQARESWQQALAIFEDIQHPDADEVRAKLASASDHAPLIPSA